jgi:hypothetical protein
LDSGLFVAPVSPFAASALLFACLLVCLMAMASFSNPHRACRDACTTTSPALEPGGAATDQEAVNTHSNARFGGEVEWNVSGTATSSRAQTEEPERGQDTSALPSIAERPIDDRCRR